MDAAQLVREWRRREGLTQEQLARRAGMQQQAVARIERGHQIPRLDTLQRLLTACGAVLRVERPLGAGVGRAPIRTLLARPATGRLLGVRAPGFGPVQALRMLTWRRLSFVVVGALAARLHGAPVSARVTEISLAPGRANRERLGRCLRSLHGPALTIPPAVATYHTGAGSLRCVRVPSPIASYAELFRGSVPMDLGFAGPLYVACLEDLLRIRLAPRRRRDRHEAEILAAVADERDGPPDAGSPSLLALGSLPS